MIEVTFTFSWKQGVKLLTPAMHALVNGAHEWVQVQNKAHVKVSLSPRDDRILLDAGTPNGNNTVLLSLYAPYMFWQVSLVRTTPEPVNRHVFDE